MEKIEVKVLGTEGDEVITLASEIALALRLVGFRVSTCGNVKGKTSNRIAQTERVKRLTSSDHNHIKITCEQSHA